jgi:hypothetical protein
LMIGCCTALLWTTPHWLSAAAGQIARQDHHDLIIICGTPGKRARLEVAEQRPGDNLNVHRLAGKIISSLARWLLITMMVLGAALGRRCR